MAMIKCDECGKDISDKAAACVHCGKPLKKTWKGLQLAGIGVMALGLVVLFVSSGGPAYSMGIFMLVSGGIITIIGGITAWWHYG